MTPVRLITLALAASLLIIGIPVWLLVIDGLIWLGRVLFATALSIFVLIVMVIIFRFYKPVVITIAAFMAGGIASTGSVGLAGAVFLLLPGFLFLAWLSVVFAVLKHPLIVAGIIVETPANVFLKDEEYQQHVILSPHRFGPPPVNHPRNPTIIFDVRNTHETKWMSLHSVVCVVNGSYQLDGLRRGQSHSWVKYESIRMEQFDVSGKRLDWDLPPSGAGQFRGSFPANTAVYQRSNWVIGRCVPGSTSVDAAKALGIDSSQLATTY